MTNPSSSKRTDSVERVLGSSSTKKTVRWSAGSTSTTFLGGARNEKRRRRTVGPRRDRERSPVRFGNASSDVEPQSEVPLLRRVEGGECFRRVVDAGSA